MSVHQQTDSYLLGYADALEFVGTIVTSTTKRGLTTESTIEMMNSIIRAIHESQGMVQQQQEFASLDEIIEFISKGGK